MRALAAGALTQLQSDRVVISGAARFSFGATWRFWGGYGDLVMSGEGTFKPVGAQALLTPFNSEIGSAASGVELRLSALDPDVAASIEAEDYHQKSVVIWRLVFDEHGTTLLGQAVMLRGRVDTVVIEEQIGGDAAIVMMIEGGRRDMSRKGSRVRADTDQRLLGGSTDGAMKHITTAGRRTLYWGRKPSTPATLNGGDVGGGGVQPVYVTP